MPECMIIGLARNTSDVHMANGSRRAVTRENSGRNRILAYHGQLSRWVGAMEPRSGAPFWGREVGKLSRDVRLNPSARGKLYFKWQGEAEKSQLTTDFWAASRAVQRTLQARQGGGRLLSCAATEPRRSGAYCRAPEAGRVETSQNK